MFGIFGKLPLSERRKLIRKKAWLRVTCSTGPERSGEVAARVVNMSLQGMLVSLDEPLKARRGKPLYAHFQSPSERHPEETVTCRVVWSQSSALAGNLVGVSYDEAGEKLGRSWVRFALKRLGFDEIEERRALVRFRARLRCEVKNSAGQLLSEAKVLNLSDQGALVEMHYEAPDGYTVKLHIGPEGNLPVMVKRGTLIWQRPNPENSKATLHGFVFPSAGSKMLRRYLKMLYREPRNV